MSLLSTKSIPQKKSTDKTKQNNLDWGDPFLLSKILRQCEVSFHGKVAQPEKLFTQQDIETLNFCFFGIIYRMQKNLQQNIVSEVDFLKDDCLNYGEICLKVSRKVALFHLNNLVDSEIKKIKQKIIALPIGLTCDVEQRSGSPYREIKFNFNLQGI